VNKVNYDIKNCHDRCRRIFWICIIIALIFMIVGTGYFINCDTDLVYTSATLIFLYTIWFLNLFLLVIFTYYALLNNTQCPVLIFLLFIIVLLFATIWSLQFNSNLTYANFSIIMVLIFSLAIIYLAPVRFQFLAILYLLLWLFIFFYINIFIHY
jgi:hypothetical protein